MAQQSMRAALDRPGGGGSGGYGAFADPAAAAWAAAAQEQQQQHHHQRQRQPASTGPSFSGMQSATACGLRNARPHSFMCCGSVSWLPDLCRLCIALCRCRLPTFRLWELHWLLLWQSIYMATCVYTGAEQLGAGAASYDRAVALLMQQGGSGGGSTGGGGSGGADYIPQNFLLRLSIKLFDCTPSQLPPDLRDQLTGWLQTAPTGALPHQP